MDQQVQATRRAEAAIREAARKLLPHGSLVLFGSRARGTAGRRSDFDLAVIPKPGFSARERLAFAEALEASPAIIYPIDLVDWSQASDDLRERIRTEGIVWKN